MLLGPDPEAGVARIALNIVSGVCLACCFAALAGPGVTVWAGEAQPAGIPDGCYRGALASAPTGVLSAEGDVTLSDGTRARIAGLAHASVDREALAVLLQGGSPQARSAGRADRWSRFPVEIVAGGSHVAAALLASGAAAVRPGELPAACTRSLLAIEDAARRAGRGRWAGGVLDAADGKAVAAQEGRFIVAEGRVTGIGRTASRFYLNFGAIRGESFSVSVPTRALQKFEASGMRLVTLEGRRIRVRGVVVGQGGPRVEVALPEEIERLD
jgi:hypothetical protein